MQGRLVTMTVAEMEKASQQHNAGKIYIKKSKRYVMSSQQRSRQ